MLAVLNSGSRLTTVWRVGLRHMLCIATVRACLAGEQQ